MAIANGTCVVSAINLRHNLATTGESCLLICRCLHPFCRWRHLATSRESKAHFGLPWVRPSDNSGKCYMDGKRIQCWSKHSSIYPSIFNSLRAIAKYWSEIATFSYPPLQITPPLGCSQTPPLGCSHWNSGEKFGPHKTRIMGLPGSEDSLMIG